MDFWTSTWVAVGAGLLTFLLTVVPYDYITRSRTTKAQAADDHSVTTHGDGPTLVVQGNGDATINDHRRFKKKSQKTIINNPQASTVSDVDTSDTIGKIFGAVAAVLVTAVLFVLFFKALLIVFVLGTAVTLGLVVNLTRDSVRTHGWSPAAKTLTTLAAVTTAVMIISWIGVFTTTRGIMQIEAMQKAISMAGPGGTGRGFIQRFVDQASLFTDTYGMPGVSFVAQLFLGVAAAGVLLYFLTLEMWHFRRYEAALKGRIDGKKARKRALAHGTRTWRELAGAWVGVFIVSVIAIACATGTSFDVIQSVQNQRMNLSQTP